MLGSCEHQSARHVVVFEKLIQQCQLAGLINVDHRLVYALSCCGSRCNFNTHWISQQASSKASDFFWHSGREEKILALLRNQRHNAANGVDETEIKHLVNFIEHEDFNLRQGDGAAFDKINQAAWCCNQHIKATAAQLNLLAYGGAAENHGAGEFYITAIGFEAFANLGGKLTRWCEDQYFGSAFGSTFCAFCQML